MPILGSLGAATAKGVGFTAVPAELPGIPTIGTATVTGGVSVSVSYIAPTFDGNTSILSYTAVAYNYPGGTAAGITGIAYGPNSGSVTVTGLTPGSSYTFKVYATNGVGSSGLSGSSNNVTTWVVPTAPTIGTVTYTNGNTFASVAYTQSSNNGGTPITSYTAVAYVSGVASGQTGTLTQATSGSITITGLTGGQTYTFKVYATNLVGNSPLSNATTSVSVFTKPDAPTIGTATHTTGTSATVGYTAPAVTGGSPITSYTVKAYIAGVATAITGSGSSSPLTITGLTKGTAYTFRVAATNTYGTGDYSNDSNSVTPLTIPAAPTIGTPTATSGTSANVYFTAPIDTGGASNYINLYTAISSPGGIVATINTGLPTPGTSSYIPITGLTKGTAYTFVVYATNPIGNSNNSSASTSLTPADVPNPPTINLVTTSTPNTGPTGSVIVNYTANVDNGGATVTSFTAVSSPGGITGSVSTASSGTITVTGLTKGTAYTFVVYATNRVGNSSNSNTSSSITPLTVPGAPTIGTATATGSTTATVTYTAPSDTGGSTITNYIVTPSPFASVSQTITSNGLITINSGLTKGQAYTFTVVAVNAIGTGASSGSSGSITTWTEPGAPTIGTATEVNSSTVSVSFTAGTTGGTQIIDFTVTAYVSGVATAITATGSSSPISVTGLTQGTTYTFKVTARNIIGTGPSSGASNTAQPADKPSKPTAPTVSTSTTYTTDGRVTITFTAPYDGGTTITDYYFVSSPATTTQTVSQAGGGTFVFTGLTKGTSYTFSYAAKNRIGTGTYSDASSSITPLTVPSVPTIGSASRASATSVNVSYSNSSDTGGTTITGYTATSSPGGITATSTSSPILVTNLIKGTAYTFTVHATNSRGNSGESTSSNSATPATIPNAPTIGTATTLSKNSASVSFTAPLDNGGNSITSYTAVSSPSGISATINQAGSGTITVTGLNPATQYTFVVFATNFYGDGANSSASNQITTSNSYAVSPNTTTINESSSKTVTFTVNTIGIANGTTMYWTNSGTTGPSDFDDNANSGSFTISASGSPPVGTATVTRTTVADLFTEGSETIIFNLQYPSGTTVATASTVTINDTSLTPTPTYSITENKSSINETTDRTITYSISTTYVPNGTTLYWELYSGVQAADFTASSTTGSVTISGASGTPPTGGTASFSLTAVTDHLTENTEYFFVYLGTSSPASVSNKATSGITSISDTSLTYGVVTISPTTASQNIPKTQYAVSISGAWTTTMASGTVGTITNQTISNTNTFSNISIVPTAWAFGAVNQSKAIGWAATTTAIDYAATTYTITFASVIDTGDGSYPTHALTLNRIAYTQNITVSPTSGRTNTTFTYTVTGAPGTTFEYWNSGGGYSARTTATLSGSAGDASAGTFSTSGVYWIDPGTYTVYVKWNATGHGDPSAGFSAGYATNTKVSVVVTYPPLTITPSFIIGTFWQIGAANRWDVIGATATFSASGGSGSGYSYSTPGLPSGLTQNSSTGTISGTPADGTVTTNVTTTLTDSASNTASLSHTIYISARPTLSSISISPNKVTAGNTATLSWTTASSNLVNLEVNGVAQAQQTGSSYGLTFGAAYAGQTLTARVQPIGYNGSTPVGSWYSATWTIYGVPTASISITPASVWADGASYFSASWSSTNGETFTLVTNGSSTAFTASGTSSPGPYTSTSDISYSDYMTATNGAGYTVQSPTVYNTVYALPTLSASYTTSAITGGYNVVVTWSTSNASSTSSTLASWGGGTSGTYNSSGTYGVLPAGSYGSFSITATRTISGLGSRSVTKSVSIVVPGSGTFS